MRIFVQEYATGGGLVNDRLHPSLLIEGFAILRSLILNFKKCGYEVVTTIDFRLEQLKPFLAADIIESITARQSIFDVSYELLNNCDYFLIIAPGTNNILSSFVNNYTNTKAKSLNCNSELINLATQKHLTYSFCSSLQINYPKTYIIQKNGLCLDIEHFSKNEKHWSELINERKLFFPVILKPNDGIACEGLALCANQKELNDFLQNSPSEQLLLQEFIEGEHLSVTVNITPKEVQIISLNKQLISFTNVISDYLGGVTNIQHDLSSEIEKLTLQLASNLKGLNGLVGVDYVIRNKKIYFIEINPRATTPISCLISKDSPILQLLPLTNDKGNEDKIKEKRITYFSKVSIEKAKNSAVISQIFLDDYFVLTPPLEISTNTILALIKGTGKTFQSAQIDFQNNLSIMSNKLK